YPCSTCNDLSMTNQVSAGNIVLAGGSGGSVNVAEELNINSTGPGTISRPNLQINGVNFDTIQFALSGHTRIGFIEFDDQIFIGNGGGSTPAWLQDDGSWSTFSDRRMKTDIAPAEGLLAKALALRPTEFYMNGQDCTRDQNKYLGLIAQEAQLILPSLVH